MCISYQQWLLEQHKCYLVILSTLNTFSHHIICRISGCLQKHTCLKQGFAQTWGLPFLAAAGLLGLRIIIPPGAWMSYLI